MVVGERFGQLEWLIFQVLHLNQGNGRRCPGLA